MMKRGLPNSQTWPGGLIDRPGHPLSAPARGGPASDPSAVLSLSRPDQSRRSSHRANSPPSSRSLSGGIHMPRVPVGGRDVRQSSGQGMPRIRVPSLSTPLPSPPSPDQPLIIATPTGICCAFDPPTHQDSTRRMPLLAPVPQRPRARPGAQGPSRPTVERLETIYSVASGVGPNGNSGGPWQQQQQSASPTTSRQPSVHRRKSRGRARRSATKNMKDAKQRGLSGGSSSGGKKKKLKRGGGS